MDSGERLKIARELAGLDRQQVASRTGYSLSGVGALENGQNKLRPDVAQTFANVVKTTAEWLLYATGEPPKGYDPAFEVERPKPPSKKAKRKPASLRGDIRALDAKVSGLPGRWEIVLFLVATVVSIVGLTVAVLSFGGDRLSTGAELSTIAKAAAIEAVAESKRTAH